MSGRSAASSRASAPGRDAHSMRSTTNKPRMLVMRRIQQSTCQRMTVISGWPHGHHAVAPDRAPRSEACGGPHQPRACRIRRARRLRGVLAPLRRPSGPASPSAVRIALAGDWPPCTPARSAATRQQRKLTEAVPGTVCSASEDPEAEGLWKLGELEPAPQESSCAAVDKFVGSRIVISLPSRIAFSTRFGRVRRSMSRSIGGAHSALLA